MNIGIIGMRMRPQHALYNRKAPGLDDIFAWQQQMLERLAKEGHTFLIGCADHWDNVAMKWLFYNGYADQIRLILPFPGFGQRQGEDWVLVRQQLELRKQATYLMSEDTDIQGASFKSLMDQRNRRLIQESDAVLWLWDGVQTDAYARIIYQKKHGWAFPWREHREKYTRLHAQ